MYFSIHYKKQKNDWVLNQFYEPDTSRITKTILKNTSTTKIISYGNLYCNDKKDLEKIFTILKKEYFRLNKKREELPNLVIEAIKQQFILKENN
ncbi:hypothetical protein IJD34_08655 [bacterium]|nr:hypothetical protein [bacterium]